MHQIPFCDAMYNLLNEDFCFISTKTLSEERIKMGWGLVNRKYEYKQYLSKKMNQLCEELVIEADVVILGSSDDRNIIERLKMRKLTFKYSERLYKQPLTVKSLFHAVISSYIHHGRFQKYPLYMLCASAYTAADLNIFRNYKNRVYKWGYFPEYKEYNIDNLMKKKCCKVVNILWVGRFLDLKHPEHALAIAQRLKHENVDFRLIMIGNGDNLDKIKNLADSKTLKHCVQFIDFISPEEVRVFMEKANIFLFTSDFNEGWGAVINESMNSGCAVVASHAIGSVPFLIKQGKNGLIYKNGDIDDLYRKVLLLIRDRQLCNRLGKNAYATIKNTWNADIVAKRFLRLSENLLQGKEYEYKDGPCSKAYIIKNNWFNLEDK
jgi:glycosyltransferase involved in cell wall biosynthesis